MNLAQWVMLMSDTTTKACPTETGSQARHRSMGLATACPLSYFAGRVQGELGQPSDELTGLESDSSHQVDEVRSWPGAPVAS